MAFFMYEDEEGRVQNALEHLWIRINDRADDASTAVRRLLIETASLSSRAFDSIFGQRLWSRQAIGASFAFALASMSVSDAVRRRDPASTEFLVINAIFVGSLLLSVPVDFLWSLLARWTSCKVSESQRLVPAFIALLLHLTALALLLAFARFQLLADLFRWNRWIGATVALFLASRLFLVATASVFAIVLTVVLLHKIIWPVADRMIYSLARHRVLQNRRLIGVLGLSLLLASVTGAAFSPAQFHWLR